MRQQHTTARDARMATLAADGLTARAIAESENVDIQLVRIWARSAGVTLARSAYRSQSATPAGVERLQKMAGMYRQGVTLEKIGLQFHVTRERVRQILAKSGITSTDGGVRVKTELKKKSRLKDADARAQLKFGVSHAELAQLRSDGVITAYKRQMYSAGRRGIAWRLSFAEWFSIWQTSGKLHLRGRGKGCYVMSRMRDDGCYELGNVHIQLATENSREAVEVWRGKKAKANRGVFLLYPGSDKPWFAKYGKKPLGTHATEEEAVAVRAAYMASIGVTDTGGLGMGIGYTRTKRGHFYMQATNRKSYHKTADEARAAYLAAIADLKAERASAQGV